MDSNSNFWQPKNLAYRILLAIFLSFLVVLVMVIITNGSGAGPILLFLGVTAVVGIWKGLLKSAPEKSIEQIQKEQNKVRKKWPKIGRNFTNIIFVSLTAFFFAVLFTEAFTEDLKMGEIVFSIVTCFLFWMNFKDGNTGYSWLIRNVSRKRLILIIACGTIVAGIVFNPLIDLLYRDNDYYKYEDNNKIFMFFIGILLYIDILGIVLLINKKLFTYHRKMDIKPGALFKPGDIVMLKSGGPSMVIGTVENSKIKNKVLGRGEIGYSCQWIDSNSSEPRKAVFSEVQLVKLDTSDLNK